MRKFAICNWGRGLKNKAFTLIELLAVIVILAIIALIATPLILNIIEKARKNAFLDSAYGIVDSAKLYYTESLLDGTSGTAKVFSFEEDNSELTFGGNKPKGGMVALTKEGKVSIAIHNNTWCAQKKEDGSTVVLSKYEPDKCTLDSIPEVPDDPVTPDKGQNMESLMTDEKAGENGSIRLDNNGNKRYSGSDPNNYVCFGMTGEACDSNHLYRIIGVIDGQTKIIKNSFYSTSKAWDTSNSNNWDRPATLKTELNGSSFYENTDYIDETSKGYIKNAIWYTGGTDSSNTLLSNFEDAERNSSSTGYVGLMSVTDFGYASNNTGCDRTTNLHSTNNDACMSNNWLFNSSTHQWTITPSSGTTHTVWSVYTGGNVNNNYAAYTIGVRPVLYLESNVKIKSGEGTSSNPYKLSK